MPPIDEKDIRSAVEKTKKYISEHILSTDDFVASGVNFYGQFLLNVTLPKDFPLDAKNPEEVAAFTRMLYNQDKDLGVTAVSYDKEGKLTLSIHTKKSIGVDMTQTDANEAADFQDDKYMKKHGLPTMSEYKEKFLNAFEKISSQKESKLVKGVENLLDKEQDFVNDLYAKTRDEVRAAYRKDDNVTVLADQKGSGEYTVSFMAAIDEVKPPFNYKEKPVETIMFTTPAGYVNRLRTTPLTENDTPYAKVIHNALGEEKNGTKVIGEIKNTSYPDFTDWATVTNGEKFGRTQASNGKIYNDIEQVAIENEDKKTLKLTTDYIPLAQNGTVLTFAKDIANDPKAVDYYATRWSDGSETGSHSRHELLKQYKSLDEKPNTDLSVEGKLLYFTGPQFDDMISRARLVYEAKEIGKGSMKDQGRNDRKDNHDDPEHASGKPLRPSQIIITR